MSPAFFDFSGLPPVLGWLELDNLERDLDGDEPDWICGSDGFVEDVGVFQPDARRFCCCRALFFGFGFTSECLRGSSPTAVFTSCRLLDFRRSFGKTSPFELVFAPSGGVPLPASSRLALLLFRNSAGRLAAGSSAEEAFAPATAILLVDSESTLRLDRLLVAINHEVNERPHDTFSTTGAFTCSLASARTAGREWRRRAVGQTLNLLDGTDWTGYLGHGPDALAF